MMDGHQGELHYPADAFSDSHRHGPRGYVLILRGFKEDGIGPFFPRPSRMRFPLFLLLGYLLCRYLIQKLFFPHLGSLHNLLFQTGGRNLLRLFVILGSRKDPINFLFP